MRSVKCQHKEYKSTDEHFVGNEAGCAISAARLLATCLNVLKKDAKREARKTAQKQADQAAAAALGVSLDGESTPKLSAAARAAAEASSMRLRVARRLKGGGAGSWGYGGQADEIQFSLVAPPCLRPGAAVELVGFGLFGSSEGKAFDMYEATISLLEVVNEGAAQAPGAFGGFGGGPFGGGGGCACSSCHV